MRTLPKIGIDPHMDLEPLGVDTERQLCLLAVEFCSSMRRMEDRPYPYSIADFIEEIDKNGYPFQEPRKRFYQIRGLLNRMADHGILSRVEDVLGDHSLHALGHGCYLTFFRVSTPREQGDLWLATTLGARFVHFEVSPAVVCITGKSTATGNPARGSGIVLDCRHLLTCGHVVAEMEVDREQFFQGRGVTVKGCNIFRHEECDVAVIRTDVDLSPVPGLLLRPPIVLQRVYTFGYPLTPCFRGTADTGEPHLVVQGGEVTNASAMAYEGSELFLYSAISRPGNSGRPIVSEDGYLVGISTDDTSPNKYQMEEVSPHYVGVPGHVFADALSGIDLGSHVLREVF